MKKTDMSKAALAVYLALGLAGGFIVGRIASPDDAGAHDGNTASMPAKRGIADRIANLRSKSSGVDDAAKIVVAKKYVPSDDSDERSSYELPEDEDERRVAISRRLEDKEKRNDLRRSLNAAELVKLVDPSSLPSDESAIHEKFASAVMRGLELKKRIAELEQRTPEEKAAKEELPELRLELVHKDREAAKMQNAERSLLLRQIARELGFRGEEVELFHEAFSDVYEATEGFGDRTTHNDWIDSALDVLIRRGVLDEDANGLRTVDRAMMECL